MVNGIRTTNQADSETRIIRQVNDEIGLLEPNVAPLVTFLMRLKKRVPAKSPRWEWYEDDYVARWGTNSAAAVGNNTNSTTVTVVDATIFVPGDLFVVPKTVDISTAPEMVRVTAVNTGTNVLTVVRDVGGAGVDTIYANAPLRIVGNAFEEGASLPTSKTTAPTKKTTYTQIFRTTIEFSKTAIATDTYGAPSGDRAKEHKKKLAEHKILLNSALLFGRPSESMSGGPNGRPIRTTMGLLSGIQTNITDAGGTLTKKVFEGFSRQAFRYGSSTKLLLAAPTIKSAINEWAREFLLVKPGESKYGVRVQQIETAHGVWLLTNDWMLESQGNYGFGATAFSVDVDQLRYMYLNNNGVNRDTAIHEDVLQNGDDKIVDEILTEGGFAVMQEKYHARLTNVVDYQ
jgi:Family of unknown function (DUF5309)